MNQVVCIAGPTASGKSALAIELAKSSGGEVINADALQVYADLRVLSARPSAREEASVPHHLFGHVDSAVRYSVGAWLRDVQPVILAQTNPIIPRGYWRGLVLLPDREALYARINARFDGMAESGGYDEARRLAARRLDPMLPAMKAIGLRELMAIEDGSMTKAEGLEKAKRETRRFAKRQYTWFRGQAPDWPKASAPNDIDAFRRSITKARA